MTKKIIILLIYILVMLPITVFAGDGAYKATLYISNEALNIISWVGYAIAFGALIFMGIKYLMSAANERANLKGSFGKYLIGVALIVLCSTIALVVAETAGNEDANKIVDTGFEIGNLTSDGNSSSTGNSGASMGSANVIFGELPENSDSKDNEEEKPVVKDEEKEEEKEYEEKDETEAVKEVNDKNFLKWEIYSQSSNGSKGSLVGTQSDHIYEQDVIFTSQEFAPIYEEKDEKEELVVTQRPGMGSIGNTGSQGNEGPVINDDVILDLLDYVSSEALSNEQVAKVLEVAFAQLGKPYVFGANGPDTFDCSSFVQYALKQSGVMPNIERTADYQKKQCELFTDASQAKPGDLIFFHTTYGNNGTSWASHVGIYLGDGKFIHCGGGDVNVVEPGDYDYNYYMNSHFLGYGRLPISSNSETMTL